MMRCAVPAAIAGLTIAFAGMAMGPAAAGVLFESRLTSSRGTVWYVVAQPSDCSDGMRVALRLARARSTGLPARRRTVSLGAGARVDAGDSVLVVDGVRRKVLHWGLWLRGVRRTPVLVEFVPGSLVSNIVVLASGAPPS